MIGPPPDNAARPSKRALLALWLVLLPACVAALWLARDLDGWVGFGVTATAMVLPVVALLGAQIAALRWRSTN